MNLIYENDIPPFESDIKISGVLTHGYGATVKAPWMKAPLPLSAVNKYGLYDRWKPNGITDNRAKWRRKKKMIDKINSIKALD